MHLTIANSKGKKHLERMAVALALSRVQPIHKPMSLCNTLRHLLKIDLSSTHETSALENIKIVRYIVPNLRFCKDKTSLQLVQCKTDLNYFSDC